MSWLECKVPPPLVGLFCAWLMTRLAAMTAFALPLPRVLAWPLLVLALLLEGSAVLAFVRRHTTINPLRPQQSSTLVVDGFYRVSRNPMYLGMVCLLLAWACWLQQALALPGALLFVLWINRFQIRPEERALRAHFGEAYVAYCQRVRRWC